MLKRVLTLVSCHCPACQTQKQAAEFEITYCVQRNVTVSASYVPTTTRDPPVTSEPSMYRLAINRAHHSRCASSKHHPKSQQELLTALKLQPRGPAELQPVNTSHDHAVMYEVTSIVSGSCVMDTSNRDCTSSRILASSSEEANVIARPLVPKRPARPTRCR